MTTVTAVTTYELYQWARFQPTCWLEEKDRSLSLCHPINTHTIDSSLDLAHTQPHTTTNSTLAHADRRRHSLQQSPLIDVHAPLNAHESTVMTCVDVPPPAFPGSSGISGITKSAQPSTRNCDVDSSSSLRAMMTSPSSQEITEFLTHSVVSPRPLQRAEHQTVRDMLTFCFTCHRLAKTQYLPVGLPVDLRTNKGLPVDTYGQTKACQLTLTDKQRPASCRRS